MLRAVLLGVLSLSAVACKSGSESARSQAGTVAGTVLDVSGTVTVRHGDVARPLGKGDTVEADDTIETGADGHVLVELAHNNATWELNANKKSKVRESLAWSEPKRDRTAKAVEQDTAAAGRPAERNAAETTASAAAAEEVAAPGAAPPVAAPIAPPTPEPAAAAPAMERARREASPPPPPAPEKAVTRDAAPPRAAAAPKSDAKAVRDDFDGLGVVGAGAGGGGSSPPRGGTGAIGGAKAGPASGDVQSLVRAKQADISACWGGNGFGVELRIVIKADGTASASVSSTKARLSSQVDACVAKIVRTIEFPAKAAVVTLAFP